MDLSELERLEQQQVGKLKLSDAIRIGARIRPQAFHAFCTEGGSTCAIGAAAHGMQPWLTDRIKIEQAAVILANGRTIAQEIYIAITRRNDRGQTREQIADWLEAQGY